MKLRLGKQVLVLDQPRVMGILNVTPASFSAGGQFRSPADAIRAAGDMVEAGADIVDVGGESTRPGAENVHVAEELDRVLPVISGIVSQFDIAVSVDTSKPEVMRAAVEAGAGMINDVYALRRPGALKAAADLDAAICLVHMQGAPADMQVDPHYDDLLAEVTAFLKGRIDACAEAGIANDRLVIDPGFGFGKNDGHNLDLLANLQRVTDLGLPLLVGLSRKRTLGNLTGKPAGDRVAAGIAAALAAVANGAHIIRTHDVAPTVDALAVASAVERTGSMQ